MPVHTSVLSLFFFNDPAPPEISTFPYTTLFRSRGRTDHRRRRRGARRRFQAGRQRDLRGRARERGRRCARARRRRSEVDRKSTRLNSSHSQISYAVFCLKKKKKEVESGCSYVNE